MVLLRWSFYLSTGIQISYETLESVLEVAVLNNLSIMAIYPNKRKTSRSITSVIKKYNVYKSSNMISKYHLLTTSSRIISETSIPIAFIIIIMMLSIPRCRMASFNHLNKPDLIVHSEPPSPFSNT